MSVRLSVDEAGGAAHLPRLHGAEGQRGEAETGGGRDKDAASGGSMRCSPPFEMPAESLGLRLRICPGTVLNWLATDTDSICQRS